MDIIKNVYTKLVQTTTSALYVSVVIFIIASIVSFSYSFITKQELTVLGLKPIYIISGSMQDGNKDTEIKKDSIIVSKKITDKNRADLKPGDVITYTLEGVEDFGNVDVTHRLVEINSENDTFITKGDANDVNDTFITNESSEGHLSTSRIKYKLVMRNNWISKILSTFRYKPLVFGLYALSGLMGLIIIYIINGQLYDKDLEIKSKKRANFD